MIAWLIDLVGTTMAIIILIGILTLAGLCALTCYSLCVASGKAAQCEEDHFGWRRS